MSAAALWKHIADRFGRYADTGRSAEWLNKNSARVRELFRNVRIRDVVFEPVKDVFNSVGSSPDERIRSVITQVAVSNAVLAGLPGQMGIGVVVCTGFEGWMAYTIAREIGLNIDRISDIWKYFGLLAGISLSILVLFKVLLGFAFSLFSILPGLNPMIPSELFITDLMGVLFWLGFKSARSEGKFKIAKGSATNIWKLARELFAYQARILRKGLTPQNLKSMARRLWSWLSGEVPVDAAHARGEIMATACMAWLIAGHDDGFDGQMGRIFIQAIRDRFPDLAHASIGQIADCMRSYDAGQLEGVISEIKGRMFELYEIAALNDLQGVRAKSEPDMSHPGDDVIVHDDKTGHVLYIQLKATDSHSYIEHALHEYPNVPILTTHEVADTFPHGGMVSDSGVANAKLQVVTEQNFQSLLHDLSPISVIPVAAGGVAARAIVQLWPFVMAYLRRRITPMQMEQAFKKVLGDSGVSLAARISYSLAFDAVFGWYLLARGVIKIVQAGQHGSSSKHAEPIDASPAAASTA